MRYNAATVRFAQAQYEEAISYANQSAHYAVSPEARQLCSYLILRSYYAKQEWRKFDEYVLQYEPSAEYQCDVTWMKVMAHVKQYRLMEATSLLNQLSTSEHNTGCQARFAHQAQLIRDARNAELARDSNFHLFTARLWQSGAVPRWSTNALDSILALPYCTALDSTPILLCKLRVQNRNKDKAAHSTYQVLSKLEMMETPVRWTEYFNLAQFFGDTSLPITQLPLPDSCDALDAEQIAFHMDAATYALFCAKRDIGIARYEALLACALPSDTRKQIIKRLKNAKK
jgi:hypothetical protein